MSRVKCGVLCDYFIFTRCLLIELLYIYLVFAYVQDSLYLPGVHSDRPH